MSCNAIVVDTETAAQRLGQCEELAKMLGARRLSLEELAQSENVLIAVEPFKPLAQGA
jgi:Mg-chelatase subunit ChlD